MTEPEEPATEGPAGPPGAPGPAELAAEVPAETPGPWHPAAAGRVGPGCAKPFLIGCGALLLLVFIGLIAVVVKAPSITRWSLEQLGGVLEPRIPADVSPQERAALRQALSDAGRAVEAGTADGAKLQRVQQQLLQLATADRKLTREQVLDFTRSLRELAHKPPAPAVPAARSSP